MSDFDCWYESQEWEKTSDLVALLCDKCEEKFSEVKRLRELIWQKHLEIFGDPNDFPAWVLEHGRAAGEE